MRENICYDFVDIYSDFILSFQLRVITHFLC